MRAVTVLYGSQTGCAESIAQQIHNDALARQLDAALMPLNDFQKANLVDKPGHHVIIVCSTTGNGEPPDNAGKFWRFVKRRTQPNDMLAGLAFTVLGLGDTNYDRFCYMGKSIDKRFVELGARRYYDLCTADEALGLEDMVEPWLAGLWEAFDKSCAPLSDDDATGSSSSDVGPESEPVVQPFGVEPKHEKHAELQRHLPANLISYENMFGPLSGPTQVPETLPRLQTALFTLQYIEEPAFKASSQEDGATLRGKEDEWSMSNPFLTSLVAAKYLTSSQSERKVLSVEIDLGDSGIRFKPGDAIGIKCPNTSEEVDILLARLDLDGSKQVAIEGAAPAGRSTNRAGGNSTRYPSPIAIRDIFLHYTDIRSAPKKAVLRTLATYCTDEEERTELLLLSSKLGADKYQAFVADQQLSIVDLLLLFPSCEPPLDLVLSLLPQLMPRYYSIASSPLADPKRVTVAFTIVDYAIGPLGIRRRGLCTTWLQQIAQPLLDSQSMQTSSVNIQIPVFLRSTRDFELPASRQSPMLLIGPGTGVAPFIGFLQHRHLQAQAAAKEAGASEEAPAAGEAGAISLFFGCRRRSEDWIFKEDMHAYLENGTLSALFTAFSREQDNKYYVQHDLRANGKLVFDLLQESDGHVFVCGDGVAMARDVHSALVEIVKEHGNLSADAAEARLRELSASQRANVDAAAIGTRKGETPAWLGSEE